MKHLKMNKKHRILLLTFSCFLILGCSKTQNKPTPTPTQPPIPNHKPSKPSKPIASLELKSLNIGFTTIGGSLDLTIGASEKWTYTITEGEEWVKAEKLTEEADILKITALENLQEQSRKAKIKISIPSKKEKEITITQLGTKLQVIIPESSKNNTISAEGNERLVISVLTNTDYKIVLPEGVESWIEEIQEPQTRAEPVIRNHYFSITANTTPETRTAEIKVVSTTNENISDTFIITQQKKEIVDASSDTPSPSTENPPFVLVPKSSKNNIVGAEGSENLLVSVVSNTDCKITIPEEAKTWIEEVIQPSMRAEVSSNNYYFKIKENTEKTSRSATITVSSTNDPSLSDNFTITQKEFVPKVLDLDAKIKVTSGKASEHEPAHTDSPAASIELSFDGDLKGQAYHSRWGNGTRLPVTLEYYLENVGLSLDSILYHSRNGNGNFGEFDLFVVYADNTDQDSDAAYIKVGSYNFQQAGGKHAIELSNGKPVTKVKFVVKTGLGGYVSCSEMEFFHKGKDSRSDNQE